MDDDLESAEAGLANGSSPFHKVCQMRFLRGLDFRLIGFRHKEYSLMKSAVAPIAGKGHGCFLKSYTWFRAGNNA